MSERFFASGKIESCAEEQSGKIKLTCPYATVEQIDAVVKKAFREVMGRDLEQPLAPGDVVQLKSGGPKMTIVNVFPPGEGEKFTTARVKWYEARAFYTDDFVSHTLQRVPADDQPGH